MLSLTLILVLKSLFKIKSTRKFILQTFWHSKETYKSDPTVHIKYSLVNVPIGSCKYKVPKSSNTFENRVAKRNNEQI